jgi:hypothetical protein
MSHQCGVGFSTGAAAAPLLIFMVGPPLVHAISAAGLVWRISEDEEVRRGGSQERAAVTARATSAMTASRCASASGEPVR